MLKKLVTMILAVLLINSALAAPALAGAKEDARRAEKIKAGLIKLGTGEQTRVRLKLRDKTRLEGYLARAGERDFTVVDLKTGASTTIEYAQVKNVKGNNLSTGAKIAIGVGIAAAVIFAIWFYTVVYDD